MTSSPTEHSESVNVKETSVAATSIENNFNEVVILVNDELYKGQDSEDDSEERPLLFEYRARKSEVCPTFKIQAKGKQALLKTLVTGHPSKKGKDIRPPRRYVEDVEGEPEELDRELDELAAKAMAKKIRKGKKASNK